MKKKIVMLMLAAALAATAVAGCSKNNTSQEQDIASDAQEATMPDGAIDEAFGQPSEDETGDAAVQNSNRIYGVITDVSASEQTITVDNQSDVSSTGEMILTIDPSNTEIIDAQTGLPVELSEVQSGSFEAYLGDAMTMSLPPQCTPDMVIVNIAEDAAAPQYAVAAEDPADAADLENAIVLKATDGRTYVIDKDAQVTPYLTKNIVKLQDLTAGTSCLLWEDENEIVTKVMIFAEYYGKEKFTGSAGVNAGTADSCVCSKARRTE